MPDFKIGTQSVRLSDNDVIGRGGEAIVYRWQSYAVKVFHDTIAKDEIESKISRLSDLPNVQASVVRMRDVVYRSRKTSDPIGFTMPLLENVRDAFFLAQPNWRGQYHVSSRQISEFLISIWKVVDGLHTSKVVIGDFNDGNVVFSIDQKSGILTPSFIDTDSMQYGPYFCTAAHERFLDPRRYGKITSNTFDNSTDWYAFAVLAFQSLMLVHPYGGRHPSVQQGTVPRHAEARKSVLSTGCRIPKAAKPLATLSDDLLQYFVSVFDGADVRTPLNLQAISHWTACTCGTDHQRRVCPICTKQAVVPSKRVHGKCKITEIQVCDHGETVIAAWTSNGKLTQIVDKDPWQSSRYDYRSAMLYYETDDMLSYSPTSKPIGQIIGRQTWIRVGLTFGFGYYYVGRTLFTFVVKHGEYGLRDIRLPDVPVGKLVDSVAYFDDQKHCLFGLSVNTGSGQIANGLWLIDCEKCEVVAYAVGSPSDLKCLESVRGKAVLRGRVVSVTDNGIMLVDAINGKLVDSTLFPDTEPFVQVSDEILPGPGGSLYVVRPQGIVHLEMQ